MGLVARFAPSGLPRAYWWLWTATLVNRLGNFVVPFLALYLTEARHIPVERVGWIVGCWGLGSIFSGPLGGALADRIGRRRTILVGLVGGAAVMLQLAYGVGAFVAPVVGTAILAHASSHVLWLSCFVVAALVAVGHVVFSPAHPKG